MTTKSNRITSEDVLDDLVHTFDLIDLGDGCKETGLNTLACMATTLANISPREAGLLIEGNRKLDIQTNVLVSGSTLSHHTNQDIITPLEALQNNLSQHMEQLLHELQAPSCPEQREQPLQKLFTGYQNFYADMGCALPCSGPEQMQQELRQLLSPSPASIFKALVQAPLMFVSAGNPAQLAKLMKRSFQGRSYAHIAISTIEDYSRYARTVTSFLDGLQRSESGLGSISGKLIVTDWDSQLDNLLRENRLGASWVGRAIWFVEPSIDQDDIQSGLAANASGNVRINHIRERFKLAASNGFTSRMSSHIPASRPIRPSLYKYQHPNFRRNYYSWKDYLKKHEVHFPGITAAATNLWAALYFGLHEMCRVMPCPSGLQIKSAYVHHLSRWIVSRMVKHKLAIQENEADKQNFRILEKLLKKLASGPHNTRDLYRALSLTAAECRQALTQLEDRKLVNQREDNWELVDDSNHYNPQN